MVEPPESFYETRRRSTGSRENLNDGEGAGAGAGAGAGVGGQLTQMVWEATSRQAKAAISSYGRIDLFRPYFDVEPKQVRNRLFQSLLPRRPSAMQVATDLYGPLMLIFTLVALLLYTMKTSGFVVQDGTLIGTAFFTCFGYWLVTALGLYLLCYVFSADVPLVQVLSILGYALFGHCIVILLAALFHPSHSHLFFYFLLLLFAGPSCLRMAVFFASKPRDKTHKLILAGAVSVLHLVFLLYLHFGFHTVVEELDEMFGETLGHQQLPKTAPQHLLDQKNQFSAGVLPPQPA